MTFTRDADRFGIYCGRIVVWNTEAGPEILHPGSLELRLRELVHERMGRLIFRRNFGIDHIHPPILLCDLGYHEGKRRVKDHGLAMR